MRIAVPCETDKIALQFGSTARFKFYEVERDQITRTYAISGGVTGTEEIADFLKMAGVQLVICGGIGGAAIKALDARGILVMGGIIGPADDRMMEFCAGTIEFRPIDPEAVHSHGEGHECHCGHDHGHDHSH